MELWKQQSAAVEAKPDILRKFVLKEYERMIFLSVVLNWCNKVRGDKMDVPSLSYECVRLG